MTALVVLAGAVPTTAFFCFMSQPLTCTSLTCSLDRTTARKRRRSLPITSCRGSSDVYEPAEGAADESLGLRNSNFPSITPTWKPTSRASPLRKSQSVTLPWETWSWTVLVGSTAPVSRPARRATLVATSE